MIQILLKDGTILTNNENLGMNLSDPEAILECFNEVGYYELYTKEKGWTRIYKRDVQKVV